MSETWLAQNLWLVILLGAWEVVWKGWALWLAARNNSKPWFITLLIVNTAGLLPIIYIVTMKTKAKKQ